MGVVTSMTNFCYLQCDNSNCRKKVHHYGEMILKQMARLLGWENRGEQWLCPSCVKRAEQVPGNRETPVNIMETPAL